MKIETTHLDPKRKLLDATTDYLLTRLRMTREGARSLEHLLVVVPTAQGGRNLRLALAKRVSPAGLLPPHIVQPMDLVVPRDGTRREATPCEIAALFLKFIETRPRRRTSGGRVVEVEEWTHLFRPEAFAEANAAFSLLDQLLEIWRVLCGRGLLMGDVLRDERARAVLENAQGDEAARWQELAELESAFFAFLEARGLRHPAESVHLAKEAAKPLPDGVEEVVLPALADPVAVLPDILAQQGDDLVVRVLLHCAEGDARRFDRFGRPLAACWTAGERPVIDGLTEDDIVLAADGRELAQRLVEDFPPPDSEKARPVLALCDKKLFPEISAAFLSAGSVVQNPERNDLSQSALGRLVRILISLWRVPAEGLPWESFVALLRENDVMRALENREGASTRATLLEGLDVFQNALLPTFVPPGLAFGACDVHPLDRPKIDAFLAGAKILVDILDAARAERTLVGFVRAVLQDVFAAKELEGGEGEREFREATGCVREMLAGLEGDVIAGAGLAEGDLLALARRTLDAAAYSLETQAAGVVRTEGWLELAWSEGEQMALAGLHENAVPDSIVGHAFLPDALRSALGLTSNATRLARDTWLLKELVESHGPHDIRAYVARTNDAGDICRPSRLLFLCRPAAYPQRVKNLFGDLAETTPTPPRRVVPNWMLRLPDEVPLPNGTLSASAIDEYLASPFVYFLRFGLGMKKVETKAELGFDDFGSLVHRVLEIYAREQLAATARGGDQLCDENAIARSLDRIADCVFAKYGDRPTANVALQLEAVRQRIGCFARIQADWAQSGWRIAERPEYRFRVKPFEGLDVTVKGSVDRIDARMGEDGVLAYRLVDYKTWDRAGDASRHVKASSEAELKFAEALRLPTEDVSPKRRIRLKTVQLPLYGKCLETAAPETFKGRIVDFCYLVLGEDAENVRVFGSRFPTLGVGPRWNSFVIANHADLALKTARAATERILANVFWPPRPSEATPLHEFDDLVLLAPERDFLSADAAGNAVPNDWLKRQMAKLEALA